MPLPDERPRQSVANLIGRFENQTKRQSIGGTSLPTPRSGSVISHHTGDSVKEDLKEKREWPPKSVNEAEKIPATSPPSSFRLKSPPTQPGPLPHSTAAATVAMPSTKPEPTTNGTPDTNPTTATTEPVPVPAQPEKKEEAQPKTTTPSKSRVAASPAKPMTTRATSSTTSKTATRSTATTTKSAITKSPPTAPLKPQLTGQSATSTTSTRKPPSRTMPSTPARPKTPARTTVTSHPSSSSSTRTPSSNLYAPTAASLARARNTQPSPAPTPIKKSATTGSVYDRLSKPTAASLSRARSPAPTHHPSKTATATPPRPAAASASTTPAKTARGATTVKGTPRTAKTSTPPSTLRKAKEATTSPGATAAAVAAVTAAGGTATAEHTNAIDNVENLAPDTSAAEIAAEPVVKDEPSEAPIPAEENEMPQNEETGITSPEPDVKLVISDEEAVDETAAPAPIEQLSDIKVEAEEHEEEQEEPMNGDASEFTENAQEAEGGNAVDDSVDDKLNALASKHSGGDDIELMVNLLETVPITKSASEVNSAAPSDIQEIPDEE